MKLQIRILKDGRLLHESTFSADKDGDIEAGIGAAFRATREANPSMELSGFQILLERAD
jgi:hypothetical protein